MATRTIKLMGKAYSTSGDVSIAVDFNNTAAYNGTVTTTNSEPPAKGEAGVELASWTVDTSVTGAVPLSITVTGGTFQFNNLIGNYSGYELQETDGVPNVVDGAYVVTVAPDAYFGELNFNTVESDGKDNVSFSEVDGDGQQRVVVDTNEIGDWVYTITNGVTFSCDFSLSPEFVVTEVPAPPTE